MSTPIASAPPPGRDPVADELLTSFLPGRLSEIVGPRSSGGSSLLMAVLARATAAGGLVGMVDMADSLDPVSAREAGVDLRRLLWVRCRGRLAVALRAADLLTRCSGFAVVGLDFGPGPTPRVSHAPLVRLQRAVESGGAVLILRARQHVTASAASLVLSVEPARVRWRGGPRLTCLDGLDADVRVAQMRGERGASPGVMRWSIGLSAAEWASAPPVSPSRRPSVA
jgi:hypothetical protein